MLVARGFNGSYSSSVESYNLSTYSWLAAATMGINREAHTSTLLTNGQILMTGGTDGSTTLASVMWRRGSSNPPGTPPPG